MKKVLVIVCVAAMLLAVASVAMATEAAWLLSMRAGVLTGTTWTYASTAMSVGTVLDGTDGFKSGEDTAWTEDGSTAAQMASYLVGTPATPPYVRVNKAGHLTGELKEWEIRAWAGASYGGATYQISYWNVTTQDMVPIIGTTPYDYWLEMVYDPTETYDPGTKWVIDVSKNGTSSAPIASIVFGSKDSLKMSKGDSVEGGIQMKLVAKPVPEPGSILALASGLVGMAGFAIRRRRA